LSIEPFGGDEEGERLETYMSRVETFSAVKGLILHIRKVIRSPNGKDFEYIRIIRI